MKSALHSFESTFQKQKLPGWQEFYIDYSFLKKMINETTTKQKKKFNHRRSISLEDATVKDVKARTNSNDGGMSISDWLKVQMEKSNNFFKQEMKVASGLLTRFEKSFETVEFSQFSEAGEGRLSLSKLITHQKAWTQCFVNNKAIQHTYADLVRHLGDLHQFSESNRAAVSRVVHKNNKIRGELLNGFELTHNFCSSKYFRYMVILCELLSRNIPNATHCQFTPDSVCIVCEGKVHRLGSTTLFFHSKYFVLFECYHRLCRSCFDKSFKKSEQPVELGDCPHCKPSNNAFKNFETCSFASSCSGGEQSVSSCPEELPERSQSPHHYESYEQLPHPNSSNNVVSYSNFDSQQQQQQQQQQHQSAQAIPQSITSYVKASMPTNHGKRVEKELHTLNLVYQQIPAEVYEGRMQTTDNVSTPYDNFENIS